MEIRGIQSGAGMTASRKFMWKEFGQEIKRIRTTGLFKHSLHDEAREIEVDISILRKAEKGQPIEVTEFVLLCKEYGIDPGDYLLEEFE